MTLDALTKSKHEVWCAGVEAFADYVQKAAQAAVEGAEAREIAEMDNPSWKQVAAHYSKLFDKLLEGRNYVLTLSPFAERTLPTGLEAAIFRAAGPPLKTKAALTTAGGTNDA